MLHVAFLWHMHQPYYRNPLNGEYSLPWVRLHAFKGYYDMISLLEDYPEIRQTFNLVPSLLRQIDDYSAGEAQDLYLRLSAKAAKELSPEEKKFILSNFFMCNWDTMVKPYPAYWALLKKRGLKVPEYRQEELTRRFSDQDFRDLQVWFNLTWAGHRVRKKNEGLRALLKKERGFTEEEKLGLLAIQKKTLQDLIPLYRAMLSRGQVEITASPFYHPILPLLIDWKTASRAMPRAALPGSFSHPEDAEAQISRGVAYSGEIFGRAPTGMWPSEGSVCPEMIPLLKAAGIRWMATDEGVLFKSLPAHAPRTDLYRPYRARFQGAEVSMVFRDRNLSDLIGFTYSRNAAAGSVEDFVTHLRNIRGAVPAKEEALVVIALDGENAWEHYPDGGLGFLSGLYERLSREPSLKTVPIGEYLDAHPPRENLDSLHSGSWIDQNFRIWIGSPEDNLAWSALKRTRGLLQRSCGGNSAVPPEKKALAWEEIYISEGSDWFWWFGDDFSSDNDEEFDRLFRMHLANIHLLLGAEVPEYLKNPIATAHEVAPSLEPIAFISPALDGQVTHFYEWREAGYFSAKPSGGSMYRGEGFLSGFYYGFDLERLYFRIDPIRRKSDPPEGLTMAIDFSFPLDVRVTFPFTFREGEKPSYSINVSEGEHAGVKALPHIAAESIIEVAIPARELPFHPGEKIHFSLRVLRGDLEVERVPRGGYLSLVMPEAEFEYQNWQI